ncbi:hypothetical protein CRYUN_Cryun38cG0070500 [Craigia yunnanensis]
MGTRNNQPLFFNYHPIFHYTSNQDLLTESLFRLPAKSVLKSKRVSKRWLSLISDPQFAVEHTRLHVNLGPSGLYFYGSPFGFHNFDTNHNMLMVPFLSFLNVTGIEILQSCNGLLLLLYHFNSGFTYCVCNPTAKNFVTVPLPNATANRSIAWINLAFDPSKSTDYKVICVSMNNMRDPIPNDNLLHEEDDLNDIEQFSFCAAVSFPNSTIQISIKFRSMASSSDSWIKEYNEAVKIADDINGMISERSSLPASGPETQRHASAIRRKITILGTRLDGLQSMLSRPTGKPLTEKEMNRRKDMVANLRSKANQMASAFNMSNFGNRDSLLGPEIKPDAMGRTVGLDNSGLVGLQRQIMKEQDEGLEKLEETVVSTKHIALAVNEELDLHTRLIDDLDQHVDVTDSRLRRVQKNLAILNKSTNGGCSYRKKKMDNVPKEAIEVVAQSIGITNLSPDVALALAPDVEYRVREIMQEAIKCMRHSRRTVLTANDVDSALKLRNVEAIYGFTACDPLRFKRAAGHTDLFYIDDKDVEFKEVIEAPLPKAPLDISVTSHWLAIEGVQPAIPENAPVKAPSDGKKAEYKEDGLFVDVKLPVKHILSRELQLYFDKIVELTVNRSVSIVFKQALLSLATDSGLHPLVPYFTYFIVDEVARNLNNFPLMFALMRVAWSLLQNEHIHVEPYLHQLMPSVITCLVAKGLGNKFTDNHWELRNFTAKLVASICKRFGHVYHNLQPRVTRTLLHAFLDPTKTSPQHYGAIQGLAALGPSVVRLLILPNLEVYLQLLELEMLPEKQKDEIKRHEAWCVYGALLRAAGRCMYDRLKMFPSLLVSPTRLVWKSSGKVVTNKRKASTNNLMQQPPLKKIATDGAIGMMPINSMQVDMQGVVGGFSTAVGGSSIGVSSISRQLSNDNISGREVGGRVLKTSTVLAQAWKEDTDAGNLLASLFELFGESMLSFTPTPELSFFL